MLKPGKGGNFCFKNSFCLRFLCCVFLKCFRFYFYGDISGEAALSGVCCSAWCYQAVAVSQGAVRAAGCKRKSTSELEGCCSVGLKEGRQRKTGKSRIWRQPLGILVLLDLISELHCCMLAYIAGKCCWCYTGRSSCCCAFFLAHGWHQPVRHSHHLRSIYSSLQSQERNPHPLVGRRLHTAGVVMTSFPDGTCCSVFLPLPSLL